MEKLFIIFLFIFVVGCSDKSINFVNEIEVSTVGECPDNYLYVTKNPNYVSEDFCVAQFEMKDDGFGNAVSQPGSLPWTAIDRATAITECQSLGANYDLISNAQWQTIAQNIESVSSNWFNGIVGEDGINWGHSDNTPAIFLSVSDENDPYDQTGNTEMEDFGLGGEQKRTHTLKSGAVIWDFSGNVSEWVKDTNATNYGAADYISQITSISHLTLGTLDDGGVRAAKGQFGPIGDYSTLAGADYYGGLGYGEVSGVLGGVFRGGDFDDAGQAGIFSVNLNFAAATTAAELGFRCVYDPN